MTAWRQLTEKRRLRRPSGGTEPTDGLPDEMAVGSRWTAPTWPRPGGPADTRRQRAAPLRPVRGGLAGHHPAPGRAAGLPGARPAARCGAVDRQAERQAAVRAQLERPVTGDALPDHRGQVAAAQHAVDECQQVTAGSRPGRRPARSRPPSRRAGRRSARCRRTAASRSAAARRSPAVRRGASSGKLTALGVGAALPAPSRPGGSCTARCAAPAAALLAAARRPRPPSHSSPPVSGTTALPAANAGIPVSCPLAHQNGSRRRGADSPRSGSPGPAPPDPAAPDGAATSHCVCSPRRRLPDERPGGWEGKSPRLEKQAEPTMQMVQTITESQPVEDLLDHRGPGQRQGTNAPR